MKTPFALLLLFIGSFGLIVKSQIRDSAIYQHKHTLISDPLQMLQNGLTERCNKGYNDVKTKSYKPVAGSVPLFPSSLAPYVRDSFYAMTDFAFKSFWLNQDLPLANDLLKGIADYYKIHPEYLKDRESFYWSADIWTRLLEFYGRTGSKKVQRITTNTENALYELMWQYLNSYTPFAYVNSSTNTWDVDGSENHHAMQLMTFWHFEKLLKAHPNYRNSLTHESKTPEQLYQATTAYLKLWITERAKKGLFIEMANDAYNSETIKGLYNVYDFCTEKVLKVLSGKLLDLHWALWAQESLEAIRGGGKARVYPGNDSNGGRTSFWKMAYYYLNLKEAIRYPIIHEMNNMVTSDYRLPLVVLDIALDKEGLGNFEINQRALGLAKDNCWNPPNYRLNQTFGGIARYTYCTPSFIMGTLHIGIYNYSQWTMISSQNRWQGIIFTGNPNCRIYPQCKTTSNNRAYNPFWSVQKKGCLITQKLAPPYSKGTDSMGVYISNEGFSKFGTDTSKGWLFLQTDIQQNGSFIAIKPLYGGGYWCNRLGKRWFMNNNPTSPIIIQVARKSEYNSFVAFQQAVTRRIQSLYFNNLYTQTTIYQDTLTFNHELSTMPTVNGKSINLQEVNVYDSPFVKSKWNSGIVTISKGTRNLTLDFTIN